MRGRAAFVILSVAILGLVVSPMRAQQKPFTQEQVQGMVQSGLGDETGARAVQQRGIDFTPSDDFLQSLKAAGANGAFIAAVRNANHPKARGGSQQPPMTEVQVFALLAAKIPPQRVAILIKERGIDFDPTDEYLQQVRSAGGDDAVISAVQSARVIKPQHVDPAQAARQTEIRQHTARGAEYMKNGRFADAEQEYRAAVNLAPNDADLHFNLGLALGQEGNAQGAVGEFREAVRLNPNNEWAHGNLGIALGNTGDWDGEIAEERAALRINPNNEPAHVGLGVALGSKGDLDGEITEERKALSINPNNDMAHVYLGIAEGSKGDFDSEVSEEREAIRLNPNNEGAHAFLGVALGGKRDWDGEIAEETAALNLNPKDQTAHIYNGIAHGNKGDWDTQVSEEREALNLNPNNEMAHAFLGSALAAKGDADGASAEFREAIRLNPRDAMAHNGLGLALERKGDRDGALQEYRTASELDPNNTFYRQNYDRVSQQSPPYGGGGGGGGGGQTTPADDVPGLDLSRLTPEQRQAFVRQLAGQMCTCGCRLTLLRCRQIDRTCMTSLQAARQQLAEFERNSTTY